MFVSLSETPSPAPVSLLTRMPEQVASLDSGLSICMHQQGSAQMFNGILNCSLKEKVMHFDFVSGVLETGALGSSNLIN